MSTTPPLPFRDAVTTPPLATPTRFSRHSFFDAGGLAAVPLLFLVLAGLFLHIKGPYWLGTNSDPDYPYLFNGLLLDRGEAPQHTDHPGTPVQVWVAVVLPLTHALAGKGTLAKDVLGRPEFFLAVVNWTMLAVVAVCMWIAGAAAWLFSRNRAATMLVQATPLLCPSIFLATLSVKPEPLLVACILLFVATALGAIRRERLGRKRVAVLFGILSGILLAMKISAAPVLLLPLVLLRGWRPRAVWILVCVGTLAVMLIPIYSKLQDTVHFAWLIMTHQNAYGLGTPGIDVSGNSQWFFYFLGREPLFIAVLVINLVVLFREWRRGGASRTSLQRPVFCLLLAAVAVQVATLLEFFRHPYADRYLVPGLMFVGLSGMVYLMFLSQEHVHSGPRRRISWGGVVVAGYVVAAVIGNVVLCARLNSDKQVQMQMVRALRNYPGHPPIVASYHASSMVFSLYFGNTFSRYEFAPTLEELFPHALFANRSTNGVDGFDGRPRTLEGATALLQGLECPREMVIAGRYHLVPMKITESECTYVMVRGPGSAQTRP